MGTYEIACICYSFFCEPNIFWENVGNDREKVLARAKNCSDYNSLSEIVNEYI